VRKGWAPGRLQPSEGAWLAGQSSAAPFGCACVHTRKLRTCNSQEGDQWGAIARQAAPVVVETAATNTQAVTSKRVHPEPLDEGAAVE